VSGSFSTYWEIQYESWGWYRATPRGLWRGINAFSKNIICSFFKGMAKPFIIYRREFKKKDGNKMIGIKAVKKHAITDPNISRSSPTPLCLPVSYINRKKI
jgi:hypothetical protein